LLHAAPDPLREGIHLIAEHSYEELYEPVYQPSLSLQEALEQVLSLLESSNDRLSHIRYVWMVLILAMAVQPTVSYYQPSNPEAEQVIAKLTQWLVENASQTNSAQTAMKVHDASGVYRADSLSFSAEQAIPSLQVLSESLDVYHQAIQALDRSQAKDALLNILEDCLEGYAIFPGAQGRRELFNWWLLDVVPAVWNLLPPHQLYSAEQSTQSEALRTRYMSQLTDISAVIRQQYL
jgi:hypothetical protein